MSRLCLVHAVFRKRIIHLLISFFTVSLLGHSSLQQKKNLLNSLHYKAPLANVSPSQYASHHFVAQKQSLINNNNANRQLTHNQLYHPHHPHEASRNHGNEATRGGSHSSVLLDNRMNMCGGPLETVGSLNCQSRGGSLPRSGSAMGGGSVVVVDQDCEDETASSSSPAFPTAAPTAACSSALTYFTEQPPPRSNVILQPHSREGTIVPTPIPSTISGAFHPLHPHNNSGFHHPSLPFCTNTNSKRRNEIFFFTLLAFLAFFIKIGP